MKFFRARPAQDTGSARFRPDADLFSVTSYGALASDRNCAFTDCSRECMQRGAQIAGPSPHHRVLACPPPAQVRKSRVQKERATPRIARTFPLSQIVEAHRYMESNEHIGKIVVTV